MTIEGPSIAGRGLILNGVREILAGIQDAHVAVETLTTAEM